MDSILILWMNNRDMTNRDNLHIGIALSGGGVRASVFHLGILSRLAADNLLENVKIISTVSGGTLVTGLIYAINNYRWPSSEEFLNLCLPRAKHYLTTIDLGREITIRSFLQPWYFWEGRAPLLSQCMRHNWGIWANLNDIPLEPRWVLNATAYESGRDWRFIPQRRMGDYALNYVKAPHIPLTDAMAASAGYPGLIGPLVLQTDSYEWYQYEGHKEVPAKPLFKKLHLWDGGVYDNLGTESLFKVRGHTFRDEINFAIICDASKGTELMPCSWNLVNRAYRLVGIAMDQVRGMRARTLVDSFERNPGIGVYLKMGNTTRKILQAVDTANTDVEYLCKDTLSSEQVDAAVSFPTTLRRLTDDEFHLLCTHGWEVANWTLHSRCPELFGHSVCSG